MGHQDIVKGVKILTEDEIKTLILASMRSGRPITESQAHAVTEWAQNVLIDSALLQMVLDKIIGVKFPDSYTTDMEKAKFFRLDSPEDDGH